ncbi:MAG: IS3 family transposase [Gemmatimonadota bacterium]|nr:IS3 family transposase [Gemmatimonadota bacterium]MDE2985051.1 IS3 family transposase [Gemmatimonadota bacterium]
MTGGDRRRRKTVGVKTSRADPIATVQEGGRIDPQQGYAFIKAHRARYPLVAMCRALELSSSGYYQWLTRAPSAHSRRDDELRELIQAIWIESDGTYGRPRIHAALREAGVRVSQRRVARLMKSMGLRGRRRGTGSRGGRTSAKAPANRGGAPEGS